jgi:hypothetical protein
MLDDVMTLKRRVLRLIYRAVAVSDRVFSHAVAQIVNVTPELLQQLKEAEALCFIWLNRFTMQNTKQQSLYLCIQHVAEHDKAVAWVGRQGVGMR